MLALNSILALALTLAPAPARSPAQTTLVDGDTPIGVVAVCTSCADPDAGSACKLGGETGWLAGRPCGSCLIDANFGKVVRYSRDLILTGTLHAPDGTPREGRFVKLFMANSWSVRTRTAKDGRYQLRLGATGERSGEDPLVIDLGAQVDPADESSSHFAAYLLPPDFAACPETSEAAPK